jgi:hypothetical protein
MQPIAAATPAELVHRMPTNAAKDLVEWDSDYTPEEMFDEVVGDGEQQLGDFTKRDPSVPPVQDDRPINEYFLLRHVFNRP